MADCELAESHSEQEARVQRSCAALPGEEWRSVSHDALIVTVLSGAMTNAMFLCRIPGGMAAIVRFFGELGPLIDPKIEMAIFNEMAQAKMGPQMLGVIYDDGTVGPLELNQQDKRAVGRVEEFLDGWTTLSAEHYQSNDAASPHLAAIAAKLAHFHSLVVESAPRLPRILDDIRVQSDLVVAGRASLRAERWESLLSSPIDIAAVSEALIKELATILSSLEADEMGFCHNDLQHGNVLMCEDTKRYTFIDFEYAGYNPIYFDMANIWCEVPANYTASISSVGFIQDFTRHFPSPHLQQLMASSYLSAKRGRHVGVDEDAVARFVERCQPWIRVNHVFWGLWGILQARNARHQNPKEGEFDYAAYAANRLNAFAALPLPAPLPLPTST
jgi:thiamine kinase-like enzyme